MAKLKRIKIDTTPPVAGKTKLDGMIVNGKNTGNWLITEQMLEEPKKKPKK